VLFFVFLSLRHRLPRAIPTRSSFPIASATSLIIYHASPVIPLPSQIETSVLLTLATDQTIGTS